MLSIRWCSVPQSASTAALAARFSIRRRSLLTRRCALWFAAALSLWPALGPVLLAQDEGDGVPDGTPIARVEFAGLNAISEAYVRRMVKTRAGQFISRKQVEDDVRELLRTRKFLVAFATTRLEDNQAVVVFTVQEKPTIATVELQGNKAIKDSELYALLPAAGDVLDLYAINKGKQDIIQKYKEKGYYYVEVTLDERAVQNEARVIYTINEGPRVRVREITAEGNRAYPEDRLLERVQTKTWIWIFRTGEFDEDRVERDALSIQQFYRDEGYLDARVGYRLDFDPVKRSDLKLVFVIEEGPRYRINEIVVEGNSILDTARILSVMNLKPGDFLRNEVLEQDKRRVQDLYGELGYIDMRVEPRYDFLEQPAEVLLRYTIIESDQSRFGRITIRGNDKTRDEVIRRELRFYPGEEYNSVKVKNAEQRLRELNLFAADKIKVTPLERDPDGEREALVEIEEIDTTQFLIGFGVSTDNGVIGSVTLENRNFDLFDWPRTWGEFFRGRSFRGDGQRLRITAEPGTEVSRFRIDFTEPYLFDKPLRYDSSIYLFDRGRDGYTEGRIGLLQALSRRFDSGPLANWAIEGAFRFENVRVYDVEPLAASVIRDVAGDNPLIGIKLSVVRDTTDSRFLPSKGYRAAFSWEQAGLISEGYSWGKPAISLNYYKTMRTDIFDRKSILGLRFDSSYIVGDAPVFEKFYAGGFGSVRGFEYRGISPRLGIFKNRVGGDFIMLAGAEYSIPLYANNFRGVMFVDSGTVDENFSLGTYRVAAGLGIRITADFFGPIPIVLDFGFPISYSDQDDRQVFNFAVGASF